MAKLFNKTTNRQGLLVYGGEASSDFGMVIAEAPAFNRSTRKQTVFSVPGRNGDIIIQQDAWNDVPINYNVWLAEDGETDLATAVNELMGWLNSKKGYQRLEDNFQPDIFRLAYYSGGASFENHLTQYGKGTLTFTARAELFYKSGEQPITVSNGSKINNPTRYASKPLIHIEGSGSVTIAFGGATMSATLTDYINIDCDAMNAYRLPAENLNNKISGTFPTLQPGINTIGVTGSVTKVVITPRFFTI